MRSALLLLALFLGCAPKPVPRTGVPAPLASQPFQAPATTEGKLSNGLRVVVGENHEVPLAWVRLAFRGGSHDDPAGREGLASATMDLMNEGAGEYDSEALSAALKHLGSDLGASAGDDGASLWASSLSRNLDPTLDLFSTVLLDPTFPQAEWDLRRKQRIADLDRKHKDPEWIAARVFDRVIFGDLYKGRAPSKASYEAMTTADMKAWWAKNLTPDNAILLIGGDVTLAEVMPKLEKRLAGWKPASATSAPVKVATPPAPTAGAPIHFVDRPGAAQSMLRVGGYVSTPDAAEWFPLILANQAVGGQFTARINMNLREQKGYTYGARSGVNYDLAGGRFVASAGVHTDKTAPALTELLAEIAGPGSGRPLTEAELDDGRASIVNAYPLRFESPDFLLNQQEAVWRYGLPADWISAYLPKLQAADLAQAQAAWTGRVDPSRLVIVVVGDGAKVLDSLRTLGHPLVLHDNDGNVLPDPGATDHGN